MLSHVARSSGGSVHVLDRVSIPPGRVRNIKMLPGDGRDIDFLTNGAAETIIIINGV